MSVALLVTLGFIQSTTAAENAFEITVKHGSAAERETKQQLERLLGQYRLQPWYFTRSVMIDETAIPHSHPVLTLHTRHYKDDDLLLSSFLHEQLHWFLDNHEKETKDAEADLKKLFPKVPVGYPDGAENEESGYLHLLVNSLEWSSDRVLLGELRARQIMEFWTHDHYRWIYHTVLEHPEPIEDVLAKHNLKLPE